ncbi:hypothetical protein IGI04_003307 [Brassica rapa subsp. trilocularis]|uniref:Transmembrane protein n=1 Tax=Brassica rapa subsp. trilocularis TaxID=1813537 RepID=A0ABQ7NY17_BRACM|nr:hypothetical protein IGI04_003307 [Brassica rapa subsp. trilocularis]
MANKKFVTFFFFLVLLIVPFVFIPTATAAPGPPMDAEEGVLRRGFKTDVSSIVAFVADNVSVFLPVPLATSINALAIETSLAPRGNPNALNPILFP